MAISGLALLTLGPASRGPCSGRPVIPQKGLSDPWHPAQLRARPEKTKQPGEPRGASGTTTLQAGRGRGGRGLPQARGPPLVSSRFPQSKEGHRPWGGDSAERPRRGEAQSPGPGPCPGGWGGAGRGRYPAVTRQPRAAAGPPYPAPRLLLAETPPLPAGLPQGLAFHWSKTGCPLPSDWLISSRRPSLARSGKERPSRPAQHASYPMIEPIACHSAVCVFYWLDRAVSHSEGFSILR